MCRWFAGNQIRNVSAVGGNIVTGSPISDLNPIWMASRATFTVASAARGERTIPASHFFLAYRTVDLQPDEVLLKVSKVNLITVLKTKMPNLFCSVKDQKV